MPVEYTPEQFEPPALPPLEVRAVHRQSLGMRIYQIREKREWTQRELAIRMGFGPAGVSRISDWETGKTAPPLFVAVRLSRVLGVTIEGLMRGIEL